MGSGDDAESRALLFEQGGQITRGIAPFVADVSPVDIPHVAVLIRAINVPAPTLRIFSLGGGASAVIVLEHQLGELE